MRAMATKACARLAHHPTLFSLFVASIYHLQRLCFGFLLVCFSSYRWGNA